MQVKKLVHPENTPGPNAISFQVVLETPPKGLASDGFDTQDLCSGDPAERLAKRIAGWVMGLLECSHNQMQAWSPTLLMEEVKLA